MTTIFPPRECRVLEGLWRGLSQVEVAALLGLSVHTVRAYSHRARQRAGAQTTIGAIRVAVQQGVLIP